jgi:hypothetical protein
MALAHSPKQIPSASPQLLTALAFLGTRRITTATIKTNANFNAIFMFLLKGPSGPG